MTRAYHPMAKCTSMDYGKSYTFNGKNYIFPTFCLGLDWKPYIKLCIENDQDPGTPVRPPPSCVFSPARPGATPCAGSVSKKRPAARSNGRPPTTAQVASGHHPEGRRRSRGEYKSGGEGKRTAPTTGVFDYSPKILVSYPNICSQLCFSVLRPPFRHKNFQSRP